jgi:DHA2 family multidrug resistance protein
MSAASASGGFANRGFITASIMAAALMQTLDTTIANVALPHIQGSVSASQDQITWVLTFYIVAAAIMTPLTGWLSDRFGRKAVFLFSVAGFTITSGLCGAAQTLGQIVAFRFFQGIAGAALIPLAQSTLLDINPPERYGQAMATFASAVVLGPILGPTLGGWLTENYSWRWCFFINVPVGAAAFAGTWLFMPGKGHERPPRFDFFGFATVALAVAGLQLMLDRGQTNDWFGSTETWVEAALTGLGAYLFVIHTLTAKQPLFSRELFRDGNFRTTLIVSVFVMGSMYASMALVPALIQNFYGYPVFHAGVIMMARGIGGFLSMTIAGRLVSRFDARYLMGVGIVLVAASFFIMSRFAPVMGAGPLVVSGVVQGLAMGLFFVPISTIGFATLPAHLRTQGATISNLIRNSGGSVGISILQVTLVNNIQVAHASLAQHIQPTRSAVQQIISGGGPGGPGAGGLGGSEGPTAAGLQMVNGMIARQAAMIAYIDDFWIMTVVTLCLLPLHLLLRKPSTAAAPPAAAMAD